VIIGTILRAPRLVRHTGNFSYVFSPNREQQLDYVDGLMVVSSIFLFTWIFWAFVLVVLKFRGKDVGCASGRPFVTQRSYDEDEEEDDYYHDGKHLGDTEDDIGSTSDSSYTSDVSNSNKPLFPKRDGDDDESDFFGENQNDTTKKQQQQLQQYHNEMGLALTDEQSSGNLSGGGSEWISEYDSPGQNDENTLISPEQQTQLHKINPRENRTRFCFIFFASLALICVPLIMVVTFGPMKDATESSHQIILVSESMISSVSFIFITCTHFARLFTLPLLPTI
jgi:hypothetical protein